MIQDPESRFRVEECSFKTIFGTSEGQKDFRQQKSGREDRDTSAELYNVDVRQDQRYMAEKDFFGVNRTLNIAQRTKRCV